jgi:malic enzyme
VSHNGQVYHANQCNNMFIFPGLGLGTVCCRPVKITPEMFVEAANALAAFVTEDDLARGRIYPRIRDIRAVSKRIAVAGAAVLGCVAIVADHCHQLCSTL